ncbi:hypothetical protein M9H77_17681 [Catharanthus roseus]|uniref:Uncharacterized protein n=1 Tax=Catharanthus roseus TaxID=4058 RepID=A0ACC0B5B6_CATRO|nr:hypothetical protein M9H77_17681 [Catharanthus roseus]
MKIIYLFLALFALLFCTPHFVIAKREQSNNMNPSIVLGLTHSRATIPKPKYVFKRSIKTQSETLTLDMIEPLKEIRDGYIISLNLGTPQQIIQVYMDTGSDLTWVPCGNLTFDCIDCDDYKNNKITSSSSSFSPSYSSSCSRDSCSSPFCINIHNSDNSYDPCTVAGCSLSTLLRSTCYRPCPSFAYTYGEGIVIGSLTRDTLRVHNGIINSDPREIANFCFGCVGTTYREPIGIAGFGKGPLSFPSQLGFSKKGFSHCFLPFKYANNPNISSPLIVGDQAISSKDHLQFTPMLKCPIYPNFYYIGLEAITISNLTSTIVPLRLREFDSFGNGGLLIDSGTTYTHLPQQLYSDLLTTLESLITNYYPRAKEVESRTGFDLCYRIPYGLDNNNNSNNNDNNIYNNNLVEDNLPVITFHFLNNVTLELPKGNVFYAMGAPRNSTVVKCLLFQSMDESEYGPAGVFGSFQQQNMEVVYDLEKERIGFQTTDCALAAAASQALAPARV